MMLRLIVIGAALLAASPLVLGEDADAEDKELVAAASADEQSGQPKTLSGMSILGNEEAPKSLVIIPWKSSEIGDDISLSDTLDDRARPVDKDVFLRELSFYEIRSADD